MVQKSGRSQLRSPASPHTDIEINEMGGMGSRSEEEPGDDKDGDARKKSSSAKEISHKCEHEHDEDKLKKACNRTCMKITLKSFSKVCSGFFFWRQQISAAKDPHVKVGTLATI